MVEMNGLKSLLVALTLLAGVCFAHGCASEPPPTPSKQEIKSDSDRMFDKMKQEERERNRDAGAPSR
jgi:hypothetical protein